MLRRSLSLSAAAGVMIGIGGTVFLSCESRIVGAVFFATALLTICFLGLFLFTGKVGYLAVNADHRAVGEVLLTLLGNLLGTLASGLLIGFSKPVLAEKAAVLCGSKLAMRTPDILIAAFFCGILMYAAVAAYREKSTPFGIVFCVPAFILSGFEHSIADMFYFFCAGVFTPQAFWFLTLTAIGNTLGGLLLPALRRIADEVKNG